MVLPRLSICQLWAAPLPMTPSTASMSRPARWPNATASDRPCTRPAIQIWFTILASCPAPLSPSRVTARAKAWATGWAAAKAAASPPHMTVSMPFCAPAWPPDTGASTNCRPSAAAAAFSSRATLAEAVVWSTKMVPACMPAKAPSAPSVTERRSSSLPTQQNTKSAPATASRGVFLKPFWPCAPGNSAHHATDFVAVRLYTVTLCPACARCPAMG